MAHHAAAKKSIRQIKRRTLINGARKSRMRTFLKKVEQAIHEGDKDKAMAAFRLAEPQLVRSIGHGLIHRNTVSRTLSRLSTRIKALGA